MKLSKILFSWNKKSKLARPEQQVLLKIIDLTLTNKRMKDNIQTLIAQ